MFSSDYPMAATSLPTTYFDDIYRANQDPWSFASSDYERDKYAATLAALPDRRFTNAFEIGCSIGVLSAMLAQRCDQLLSVDASELPLEQARRRLANSPQVTVAQMSIPAEFPGVEAPGVEAPGVDTPGVSTPKTSFDLILLSEVGYYLTMDDLRRTRQLIIDHLLAGGYLLMVHWTPFVHDYPLTGDQVHELFLEAAGDGQPLQHCLNQRAEKYRLDLFQKRTT